MVNWPSSPTAETNDLKSFKYRFESDLGQVFIGRIAQRSEQGTHNAFVLGSNPSTPKFFLAILH